MLEILVIYIQAEKFKIEEQRTGKLGLCDNWQVMRLFPPPPVLSSSVLWRMSVDECLVVEACP